tara:strand:+ start:1425 stop:2342 length:918 start_codon:yes stop_codon:yes gene_type:complete
MNYQRLITSKGELSRRLFLLGTSGAAFAFACSPQNISPKSESINNLRYLKSGFADGLVSPTTLTIGSPQRAPFFLYGSDGIPIVNDVPELISATLQLPSGRTIDVNLNKFDEGIPTPYFPLFFETNEIGLHKVSYLIDGNIQSLSFIVAERDQIDLIQIGEQLRDSQIPTFDNPLNFAVICTRFDPCPYHSLTLKEALSNTLPTALLISTPGFCQTSICGPSLEILINLLGENPDFNVIHAEVYTNPEKISESSNLRELLSPVINDYGMTFEPSFITANSQNKLTARLDYAFDKREMEAALSTIS